MALEHTTQLATGNYLVNVDGVRLLPLALLLFLVPLGHSLSGFAGLDGSLPRSLRWHRLSARLKATSVADRPHKSFGWAWTEHNTCR